MGSAMTCRQAADGPGGTAGGIGGSEFIALIVGTLADEAA
jgi:hypothetical protein